MNHTGLESQTRKSKICISQLTDNYIAILMKKEKRILHKFLTGIAMKVLHKLFSNKLKGEKDEKLHDSEMEEEKDAPEVLD